MVQFKALLGVFLIVAAFTVPTLVAHARTIEEIQQEINQNNADKEAASGESGHLHKKATTVEGQIEELQDQIAGIQVKIDSNVSRQEGLSKKIKAAQKRIAEQKSLLSANIRSMYIEGDITPLEMLASSKNISDFVDKQEYRDRIKENIVQTVDEVEKLKKQLDEQKQEVTAIITEQKGLRGTLGAKEGEANSKLASINQSKSSFDAIVKQKQGDIAELQAEIAAAQEALARINVGSLPSSGGVSTGSVIGTVGNTGNSFGSHLHLRAQSNGVALNPLNYLGGRWAVPLNAPITQGFGANPWQYGYGAAGHDGVDYGAGAGTAIKAVEGGTLYKGWSDALLGHWYFGCMAMIEHSDGLISIYAHMEAGNCKLSLRCLSELESESLVF
jgi:septal ring factor EnvC (AmiA/AmiB activator)